MRRVLRYMVMLLGAAVLAAALGTLVPRPFWPAARAEGEGTRHILVLKNPIHTDIAVPLDDSVRRRFAFLADTGLPIEAPGARYIVFGRGGRAFYLETPTWSQLKTMPVLKALTLDASVMHVDAAGAILEPHPDVAGFDIDEEHFSALLDYIAASFRQGEAGGPMAIENAGYSTFDRFYEANGHFNALVGCNTWTGAGLRVAGLRTGWWNPLPVSLGWSLSLYN
ncbi:TIGR02117 family protein [Mesorhizobium sp. CA18]|uniref:TIGR02117 family protein n=1 Tax=unclassified Mesorhizobium TaxID=325217 RepID=UPI001CCF76F8|nr:MULTISPECIES: TIGR02117 family protein [unclassified Mesorhizobium]MBZ9736137.1 TIGR02117 family protein [Mesorhizobium sp. CA9]MBZ9827901.1 TIGR02117 family protein [Mesorhizobium sp. CA18]MBZ9833707.1 TIGR02117 family protein [Mesorhizobium sp. CA2]MBZ9839920.1 TIGR02117 family protein [Mesorhizobium sp. CA3]MBZ9879946.1 TIGR02117 family protein [Mesorhizobium sp. Ca11]